MAQFPPPAEQPKKNTTVVVIVVLVVVVGFCFFIAIGAAILFPVFAQAKLAARKASTMATAKTLSLSLLMYSSDNDDRFPPQLSTSEDLLQVAEQYSPPGRLEQEPRWRRVPTQRSSGRREPARSADTWHLCPRL